MIQWHFKRINQKWNSKIIVRDKISNNEDNNILSNEVTREAPIPDANKVIIFLYIKFWLYMYIYWL